jgi:hypothetical protein
MELSIGYGQPSGERSGLSSAAELSSTNVKLALGFSLQ